MAGIPMTTTGERQDRGWRDDRPTSAPSAPQRRAVAALASGKGALLTGDLRPRHEARRKGPREPRWLATRRDWRRPRTPPCAGAANVLLSPDDGSGTRRRLARAARRRSRHRSCPLPRRARRCRSRGPCRQRCRSETVQPTRCPQGPHASTPIGAGLTARSASAASPVQRRAGAQDALGHPNSRGARSVRRSASGYARSAGCPSRSC